MTQRHSGGSRGPKCAKMIVAAMTTVVAMQIAFLIYSTPAFSQQNVSSNQLAVSAPIDTESSAKGGDIAINSVFRVICADADSQGTGFLHKSGKVITAAHVVRNCTEPLLQFYNGAFGSSTVIDADPDLDIAIIDPLFPIDAQALPVSKVDNLKIGAQVSTWGFPGGYSGLTPMLSVGYLSGIQVLKPYDKKNETQWVVNAAFNRGNSGGPLLLIETGEVIGVVSSKAANFSPATYQALKAMKDFKGTSMITYTETFGDGTKKVHNELEILGMVLEDLKNQTQLVIGNAVRANDLRAYLKAHDIDP